MNIKSYGKVLNWIVSIKQCFESFLGQKLIWKLSAATGLTFFFIVIPHSVKIVSFSKNLITSQDVRCQWKDFRQSLTN